MQHQELDAAASLLAGDNGGLRERRGVIQSVNDMSRTCVVHWFSLQQLADRHGADWAVGSVVEENVSLYDVQPVTSEGKDPPGLEVQFLVGDCVMWTGSVAATQPLDGRSPSLWISDELPYQHVDEAMLHHPTQVMNPFLLEYYES